MLSSKEGQVRKRFFIQLSLVCQLILLVFTLVQADALRSSYTGYLGRSKALCLYTVLRPYYAQKTERTSSYLTLHSFFLVCSSQECRKQAFVNIMCI